MSATAPLLTLETPSRATESKANRSLTARTVTGPSYSFVLGQFSMWLFSESTNRDIVLWPDSAAYYVVQNQGEDLSSSSLSCSKVVNMTSPFMSVWCGSPQVQSAESSKPKVTVTLSVLTLRSTSWSTHLTLSMCGSFKQDRRERHAGRTHSAFHISWLV